MQAKLEMRAIIDLASRSGVSCLFRPFSGQACKDAKPYDS
jgi:hypothetical protein